MKLNNSDNKLEIKMLKTKSRVVSLKSWQKKENIYEVAYPRTWTKLM